MDSIPLGTLGKVEVLALARDFALPQVAIPSALTFGESLRLLGYDLDSLRPGVPLQITLYWQARAALSDFVISVQIIDPDPARLIKAKRKILTISTRFQKIKILKNKPGLP
mgnify:CR=1 FL=1